MEDLQAILKERGEKYGPFDGQAAITQAMKEICRMSPGWMHCAPHHREALEMIAHKVGRILNGDPDYDDSWRDIAGYAQLVVNELTKETPQPALSVAKKKRIYLAGPMTGLPDFNRPAFHAAAKDLRDQGHEVVNPAELCDKHGTSHSWEWYMRQGLKALADCDAIVMLPGWEGSRGARIEHWTAMAVGMLAIPYLSLEADGREA